MRTAGTPACAPMTSQTQALHDLPPWYPGLQVPSTYYLYKEIVPCSLDVCLGSRGAEAGVPLAMGGEERWSLVFGLKSCWSTSVGWALKSP